MQETSFQIRERMVELETQYESLLLELRQAEEILQQLTPEYQSARNGAWMEDSFKSMLKYFPSARNSSTIISQLVDAWVDERYEKLATRYTTAQSRVLALRELLRRYEPLIDLVKQQAILSSVEAKISGAY